MVQLNDIKLSCLAEEGVYKKPEVEVLFILIFNFIILILTLHYNYMYFMIIHNQKLILHKQSLNGNKTAKYWQLYWSKINLYTSPIFRVARERSI